MQHYNQRHRSIRNVRKQKIYLCDKTFWGQDERKGMVNFRITEEEKAIVQEYCQLMGRTQTDVFREFVRALDKKLLKLRASKP